MLLLASYDGGDSCDDMNVVGASVTIIIVAIDSYGDLYIGEVGWC